MNFIRPEVKAFLVKWCEVLVGLGLVLFGLYVAVTSFGLTPWAGGLLMVVGAAVAVQGVLRARFPLGRGGVGVVEVTERQIAYFGPDGGGVVSINELIRVMIYKHRGVLHWQFDARGTPSLTVPNNATKAATLYDALASLDGVDLDAARRAMTEDLPMALIWQSKDAREHTSVQ
jgi:hypothetical protein